MLNHNAHAQLRSAQLYMAQSAAHRRAVPCVSFFREYRSSINAFFMSINIFTRAPHGVPALAGTHAPGKAGQHLDLFDSIFNRVKTVTTQHIVYACRM